MLVEGMKEVEVCSMQQLQPGLLAFTWIKYAGGRYGEVEVFGMQQLQPGLLVFIWIKYAGRRYEGSG